MPPKRKAPAKAPAKSEPKERRSKLAKENNISAREEAEIKNAFELFAQPIEGEKEGVIPTEDVRRAMVALGIAPTKSELREFLSILDPDEEGHALYEPFVAICALKLHAKAEDEDDEARRAEVDEAFRLFTGGGGGGRGGNDEGGEAAGTTTARLTLAHLKRVVMTLKQEDEVDEQLLKDMILEANGGAGVGRGVSRDEFEEVMRRAGAWK